MLTYNSTISVYSLHKHCKEILNTIGNGWSRSKDYFQYNYKIEPINQSTEANQKTESTILSNGRDNPCEKLLLVSDEDYTYRFETELIVSLPHVDAEDKDGILNIRLPFKRKQNFNFNSKASAFVLLKYYVTVSKCYEFRKQASERFDMRFLKLIKEKFAPYLRRDEFYPGFGAILRISESLKHRAIVARNIEDDPADASKQLKRNGTDINSDDFVNDVQGQIYNNHQNETSFFEQIIHFMSLDADGTNESKKIEIIFLILVATVLSLAFIILCCCIVMKSRQKNKKTNCQESQTKEKKESCFTSLCKRFKSDKKGIEKATVSESNIDPRSSSILVGNDFDDTGMIEI